MSQWGPVIKMASTFLICVAVILSAQPAMACSVCYGDPNSSLTHGAQAGMLVLLGVIGVVLMGLASLLLFWMRRAANLEELGSDVGEASGAWAAESRGSSQPGAAPSGSRSVGRRGVSDLNQRYAVIDLWLHSESGLDVISIFKARSPSTVIAALTGYHSGEAAQRAIELGATACLSNQARRHRPFGACPVEW